MASPASSAARQLCMLGCRRAPGVAQLHRAQPLAWRRPATERSRGMQTSVPRLEGGRRKKDGEDGGEDDEGLRVLDLKRMKQAFVESASAEGLMQLDELAKSNGHASVDEYLESALRETPGWSSEDRALEEELHRDDVGDKPNKSSFWYDEDDPETHTEEHDEFDEDDITSMAHGKLDEVREMRQYARLIVWEMPLLSKLAKPFESPTPDQVLRWRYTTYMGESHPAEKKVVVQFAPDDLGLSEVQTAKLKKLVGPRYNPETELVKMSCESFEHQAQNKQYLAKLVGDLVAAAKDAADMFEDVPLDLRHHRVKVKPRFPSEWRLTEERRRELEEHRGRLALEDGGRAEGGVLVDGRKVIDEYLMRRMAEEEEENQKVAEMVPARR